MDEEITSDMSETFTKGKIGRMTSSSTISRNNISCTTLQRFPDTCHTHSMDEEEPSRDSGTVKSLLSVPDEILLHILTLCHTLRCRVELSLTCKLLRRVYLHTGTFTGVVVSMKTPTAEANEQMNIVTRLIVNSPKENLPPRTMRYWRRYGLQELNSNFRQLKHITLSGTPWNGLDQMNLLMENLTEICLENCYNLRNIDALSFGSKCIIKFSIINCHQITSLAPLTTLTRMRSLEMGSFPMLDITAQVQQVHMLSELRNLDSLALRDDGQTFFRTDLAPLSLLTTLTSLSLHKIELLNYYCIHLQDMTNLVTMELSDDIQGAPDNVVTSILFDLSLLARLTQLKQIHIHNCWVNNLTCLSTLTALETYDISSTAITDKTPYPVVQTPRIASLDSTIADPQSSARRNIPSLDSTYGSIDLDQLSTTHPPTLSESVIDADSLMTLRSLRLRSGEMANTALQSAIQSNTMLTSLDMRYIEKSMEAEIPRLAHKRMVYLDGYIHDAISRARSLTHLTLHSPAGCNNDVLNAICGLQNLMKLSTTINPSVTCLSSLKDLRRLRTLRLDIASIVCKIRSTSIESCTSTAKSRTPLTNVSYIRGDSQASVVRREGLDQVQQEFINNHWGSTNGEEPWTVNGFRHMLLTAIVPAPSEANSHWYRMTDWVPYMSLWRCSVLMKWVCVYELVEAIPSLAHLAVPIVPTGVHDMRMCRSKLRYSLVLEDTSRDDCVFHDLLSKE
eukprot:CFRG3490T1